MRVVVLVTCLTFAAFASSVSAQNRKLDFALLNATGLTITELYVSPAKDDEWGEDVLGRDVLKSGETLDIEFSRTETDCVWDMKIVDEDKDDVTWDALDLCKASHITLRYENGPAHGGDQVI